MKRIKTLIAGILGTVANLAWTIMYGYTLIVLIALLGGSTGATGAAGGIVIFTNAIIFLSALLGLIFSILSLVYFNSSAEVFEKKKKFNVTAIVFNFISAFFFLLTFFGEGVTAGTIVTAVIAIAVYVAANVLYILDMKKEKSAKVVEEPTNVESDKPQNEENKENK